MFSPFLVKTFQQNNMTFYDANATSKPLKSYGDCDIEP